MDRYEEAVLEYITGERHRFVSPQFDILNHPNTNQGGSCPDFVALDHKEKTVYIIEVTSGTKMERITSRLAERNSRWIAPIKAHFNQIDPCFSMWEFRVTVFIRDIYIDRMKKRFQDAADVSFISIEKIIFPYSWTWNGNIPANPLR